MTAYLARRCVLMLSLMMVVFVIIQLPPGNYVSTDAERLQACGNPADQAVVAEAAADVRRSAKHRQSTRCLVDSVNIIPVYVK